MSAVDASVVVPVRNDASHLRQLLDALGRQTVTPAEVIVVDNASTDESARIARDWGASVIEEPRVGIAFAAATGYDAARADIIARLDADTVPGPRWLEQLIDEFTDERIVAVSGPGIFRGLPPLIRGALSGLYVGAYVIASGLALAHAPVFGTNMAFRRAWWREVGQDVHLTTRVHDDMDLSFRVRPWERVVFTPRIRVHMASRALSGKYVLRLRRALDTCRLNWRAEKPWQRWARRVGHAWRR